MKQSNYHNSSFAEHVQGGKFNSLPYLYSVDFDKENEIYDLSIHSTSLSELYNDESGVLESYSYMEQIEAYEDIKEAIKNGVNLQQLP